MRELDVLAHELAYENAVASLESERLRALDGGEEWWDTSTADLEDLEREVRYLTLRGAILRHPAHSDWLRIVEPGKFR